MYLEYLIYLMYLINRAPERWENVFPAYLRFWQPLLASQLK